MLVNLLLVTTLATLLTGQIVRLPIGQSGAITLMDVSLFVTILVFLFQSLIVKKSLKVPPAVFTPFILFILTATASTVIALDKLTLSQVSISSLFLIRFVAYFFFCIIVYNSLTKSSLEKWIKALLSIGVIFAIIGFFQFIFFSNLSDLQAYGWDPHQLRLTSTMLDPNFTGSLLSIFAAFSLSFYLFKGRKIYLAALIIFVIAIILTFSRSSYLAIAAVVSTIGFAKAPRVLFISLAVFVLSFILIGQVRNRVIGALTIDETASARIESWQKALAIFKDNALAGVGFNTYRYTQANYGFFSYDNPLGGHSGAGSDSSILLVAATCGIIGLSLYIYLLINISKVLIFKAKVDPLHLGGLSAFFGLLVDSQFVNSLFFPPVMLIFFFILGVILKNDT